jgi:hypothetical protein
MAKSFEKRLLLFKIEATEGTDPTPVVGTDAILTRNLDASGMQADERVRLTDGQYFGSRPSILNQIRQPIRFEVEIAGGGTATTPPPWMKPNRVCGFDAGVAGGSNVLQTPISATIPSATLYPWYDNLRIKTHGTRGTFSMTFEDDEIPFFSYDMLGFPPATPVDENTPGSPTLTAFQTPVLVSTANTTFSLGSYSPPMRRLTINVGASIEPRSLVGPSDKAAFRNREMTFEAVVELPDLSAKNYYTNMVARTTQALSIAHGTAAGNIVTVAAARAEIGLITLSEEQGQVMATIPGRLIPSSAGNDEMTITTS